MSGLQPSQVFLNWSADPAICSVQLHTNTVGLVWVLTVCVFVCGDRNNASTELFYLSLRYGSALLAAQQQSLWNLAGPLRFSPWPSWLRFRLWLFSDLILGRWPHPTPQAVWLSIKINVIKRRHNKLWDCQIQEFIHLSSSTGENKMCYMVDSYMTSFFPYVLLCKQVILLSFIWSEASNFYVHMAETMSALHTLYSKFTFPYFWGLMDLNWVFYQNSCFHLYCCWG